ncbi:DUF262 domain-containing protein [Sphingopyxis sp. JAI108]|uniref:DUF262 domain-containing protein n=1 Tax=Sphingopyxis sp. JAI108 TaxID=2723060 RepID=UPI0015CC9B9F|nr:DUF262 domain-containing protein [Sphingopyxis sp. JAI108]NYF33794.1 hypothetical protein [Sphingopyxis sp. JAI108]
MESIESKEIRTEAVDFSFGELLNLHRDGEIVIQPEYQRLFRWSNEQRSRLIESILLRLPIPPIFLIENENGVLELIDGLQRTSSVLQFLDHEVINEPELVLEGCDILSDINGMKYEEFSTSVRLGLKRTPIRAVIIKKSGDEYVKYEMFKRLNTGGSLLSPQEIRNCSSRMIAGGGDFYAKLQALASSEDFKMATSRVPDPDIEQRADEELVLRYFAVRHYRDAFRGNVREWLDSFMEDILFKRTDAMEDAADFEQFFKFIAEKLGDTAFSRSREGQAFGRLAPAYFEAVVGALAGSTASLEKMPSEDLKQRLSDTFETAEFKAASGPGANSKGKMETRIDLVKQALVDE